MIEINAIKIETPVDKIIHQLKNLIISGELKPGDKLPSERVLAESFGIGRSYVREAILKLEFYGLLKINPQSGTYVSGLSIKVIDSLISDLIKFNKESFGDLIEARYCLEIDAIRLAAERRTEEDLLAIEQAAKDYESKVNDGKNAVEEDMLFHISIAKAAKSSVIESMIYLLIPDLIRNIIDNNICGKGRGVRAIEEHFQIVEALKSQDAKGAESAMANHLDEILQVSRLNMKIKQDL